jgi:hypothetical protein
MLLKRNYDIPDGWVAVFNTPRADGTLPVPSKAAGICLNPPAVKGIELLHTGASRRQNFSDSMVDTEIAAGRMAFDADGNLVVYTEQVALRYKVLRTPGSYCLHCGENLNDDTRNDGAISRAHVAEKHPGISSPDPANPAGYERIHHYECELDAEQHAKYCFAQYDAKRKGRA